MVFTTFIITRRLIINQKFPRRLFIKIQFIRKFEIYFYPLKKYMNKQKIITLQHIEIISSKLRFKSNSDQRNFMSFFKYNNYYFIFDIEK